MAVTSTKPYVGVPRDRVENFNGKQIVYVNWEQHLLFATPLMLVVEPGMRFVDMVQNIVKTLIQADPDSAGLDLTKVQWRRGNTAWTPNFEATLAENGIVHKEQLHFSTPGVNTLLPVAA